jgi:hypothetical protein
MGRVRVRSESVPLTLLLTDLDPEVRAQAAEILVGMRTPGVVDRLLQPDIHCPARCLANRVRFSHRVENKPQQTLIRIGPENMA